MSFNWLCHRRRFDIPHPAGVPVIFLHPRGPLMIALWDLVLSQKRACSQGRCIHPCPLRSEPFFARFSANPVARTVFRQPDILVDLDAAGNPISLEVVGPEKTPFSAVLAVLEEFGVRLTCD